MKCKQQRNVRSLFVICHCDANILRDSDWIDIRIAFGGGLGELFVTHTASLASPECVPDVKFYQHTQQRVHSPFNLSSSSSSFVV